MSHQESSGVPEKKNAAILKKKRFRLPFKRQTSTKSAPKTAKAA